MMYIPELQRLFHGRLRLSRSVIVPPNVYRSGRPDGLVSALKGLVRFFSSGKSKDFKRLSEADVMLDK